jgi:hypothetical protein
MPECMPEPGCRKQCRHADMAADRGPFSAAPCTVGRKMQKVTEHLVDFKKSENASETFWPAIMCG